ncbi:MAG TPA: hypothetical protein QGF58_11355 [Myxococcota bacterium]|nr:hypothetical protein [Myxococcota bacterium]
MIWMSLALADPAADTGIGCSSDSLYATSPHNDSSDVPVDLLPTIFFSDCPGVGASGLVEVHVDDELVHTEVVAHDGEGDYSWVALGLELEAETSYVLVYTPEDGGQETQIGWTTGTRSASLLSRAPEHEEPVEWGWNRGTESGNVVVHADAAGSSEGPTFIEARDSEGELWGNAALAGSHNGTLYARAAGERPADVCLTLWQRDVEGSWLEGGTDCLDGKAGGCSTGGLAAGLLPAILGLIGLRRRR